MEKKPVYVSKDPRMYKYSYDMRAVAEDCVRCSNCKWVDPWEMRSKRFSKICPMNTHYMVDAFSSQGRMDLTLAILDGKLDPDDSPMLLDIIYNCDTCGACDIMCKRNGDREVLQVTLDLRAKLVEEGQLLPQHMLVLESLRREDNTMMAKRADRGKWAEDLDIKDLTHEKADVVFHAGCHISFNDALWKVGRTAVQLLQKFGLDVGIMGKDETCCGCKVYDMGYRGEYTKYAENNIEAWETAGVKTVVTACADCYWVFKKMYPEDGAGFEVYHIVEYIAKLLKDGAIQFTNSVPKTVTYHDPCHLGRRAADYVPGEPLVGVYDAPREILQRIPGLTLVEMERIKENAWCCGAGGGVYESFPEHALWTASERVEEAASTGADAIVSACPWCENNFSEAVEDNDGSLEVMDILELVDRAL